LFVYFLHLFISNSIGGTKIKGGQKNKGMMHFDAFLVVMV
jgi:hypothetical protein